jgi:hypothetical protein
LSSFHELTIGARDKHEVPIEIDKDQAILGVEIHLEGHDIGFAVYHERETKVNHRIT